MNSPPSSPGPGFTIPPPPGGGPARGGQSPGYQPYARYPAPEQAAADPSRQPPSEDRRGGCRGCIIGCLIALLVGILGLGVVIVAGILLIKSMFPSDLTFGDAAGCAVMRVIVDNADLFIDQVDASAADKAEMRSAVRELRAEFERQCGAERLV